MLPKIPLVLIIDDNDRNRKLAGDLLRLDGIRTIEARNAAEGISLASEHLPDAILMDLRLPDLDGKEATRLLGTQPRTARIPVVAMTALRIDARDDWVSQAGFAGYISKPFDIDALAGLVRGFCARK